MEYFFSPVLSIKTVVSYTQKGFSYKYTYREGYKRFNYLTVSPQANLYVFSGSQMEFLVYLAPYVSYWLTGYKFEADYRNSQLLEQKINFSDTAYSYNRLDAGAEAGIGLKYWQTGSQAILLNIGFQYSTVSNDRQNVAGTKNRSILFSLGYIWVIK